MPERAARSDGRERTGKEGVAAELEAIAQARANGQFAIHHDLTNCLRIGDLTVFSNDGTSTTIEVKSDSERRRTVQRRRLRAAQDAVQKAGPLPGQDRKTVLYDLDIPFRTHIDVLKDGTERAAHDGLFAAKLPSDRALLVADIYGCNAQAWAQGEFGQRLENELRAALRRAGIGEDRQWHVTATSLDSVSRDPLRVPFAAYPLHPVACARIIGDLAMFSAVTSGLALADSLRRAGIEARWVRPPGTDDLMPSEVVWHGRPYALRGSHGDDR